MQGKTFYELAAQLHNELVKYYGGEFPLVMAIQETRIRHLATDVASFVNPNMDTMLESMRRSLGYNFLQPSQRQIGHN